MATSSSNVRVGGSGELYVGNTGTTVPTTTGTVPTGMAGLGYVSEDGATEARERSTEAIKAWGGATVRTVVTDAGLTYSLTLIETNEDTIEFFYGTTVTRTSAHGKYVIVPESTGGRKAFMLDVIDGTDVKRIFVPQGELGETGDVVYAGGVPIGYECTLTTYPDSGIGGNAVVLDTALKTVA